MPEFSTENYIDQYLDYYEELKNFLNRLSPEEKLISENVYASRIDSAITSYVTHIIKDNRDDHYTYNLEDILKLLAIPVELNVNANEHDVLFKLNILNKKSATDFVNNVTYVNDSNTDQIPEPKNNKEFFELTFPEYIEDDDKKTYGGRYKKRATRHRTRVNRRIRTRRRR
jgi:hypothetical protein